MLRKRYLWNNCIIKVGRINGMKQAVGGGVMGQGGGRVIF